MPASTPNAAPARAPRRSLPALLVALATVALPATAPTTSARAETPATEAEASRQLEFARAELKMGLWERARRSAASALRLDPGLFEALMVQGLALEGKGELARAEALLRTYIDLTGEEARPEAHAALARLVEPAQAAPLRPRRQG